MGAASGELLCGVCTVWAGVRLVSIGGELAEGGLIFDGGSAVLAQFAVPWRCHWVAFFMA